VKATENVIGESSFKSTETAVLGGENPSPAFLLEQLRAQKEENYKLLLRIDTLQDQLSLLMRLLYGSKSEKRHPAEIPEGEQSLFSDSELTGELLAHKEEPVPLPQPTQPKKNSERKTGRVTFSKDFSVEVVPVPLGPEYDLKGARLIGTEITTVLVYTPGRYSLKEYHREKYYIPGEDRIVIADLPSLPIPKGEADATMLAHVTVSKYVDHLPFYRQTKIMSREGIHIAESTINGWFDGICRLMEPLYKHLQKKILESHYIQADETTMPVQTKEKEGSTHKGYLWNFYSPPEGLMCFI
jgi:transposase